MKPRCLGRFLRIAVLAGLTAILPAMLPAILPAILPVMAAAQSYRSEIDDRQGESIAARGLELAITPYEQSQATVTEALLLAEQGDRSEALELLGDALREVGAAVEQRPSRLLLTYTIAYLHQQAEEFAEAYVRYAEVLREVPEHAATRANLSRVYESMGAHEWVEPLIVESLRADRPNSNYYAAQLGEYYLRMGQPRQARRTFIRALDEGKDYTARIRLGLVAAYRALPSADLTDLYRRAQDWQEDWPEATRQAYALIVARWQGGDRKLAAQALLAWAALLARNGELNAEALAVVPEEWHGKVVVSLRLIVTDPAQAIARGSRLYYGSDLDDRATLGEMCLQLGQDKLAGGDLQTAEAYLDLGRKQAPTAEDFWSEGLDARYIQLDLLLELARIYYLYPQLDPGGDKLAQVEHDLYQGKAAGIMREDLEAAQRFHTILGTIYVERDIWTSPIHYANARYQLSHAIKAASKREAQSGFRQPVPWLNEQLAEGLRTHGTAPEVAEQLVAAAKGYLDLDRGERAAQALDSLPSLSELRPGTRQSVERLAQILDARRRVGTTAGADADLLLAAITPERAAWLHEPVADVDAGFLARQRFKILADLSAINLTSADPATSAHEGADSARLAAAVAAIDVATGDDITLIGVADIGRLERVAAVVLGSVQPAGGGRQVTMQVQRKQGQQQLQQQQQADVGHAFKLSSPAALRPRFVNVGIETLVARDIVTQMGVDEVIRERPQLRIERETVTILQPSHTAPDAARAELLESDLRRLDRVGNVQIRRQ